MTHAEIYKVRHRRCSFRRKALLEYLLSFVPYYDIVCNVTHYIIPLHHIYNKSDDFLNTFTKFIHLINCYDSVDSKNKQLIIFLEP